MARQKTDAEYASEAFWTFGAPLIGLFVLAGVMAYTGRRRSNPGRPRIGTFPTSEAPGAPRVSPGYRGCP